MSSPIASVILPAFNRLAHLRAAIDSVRAQTLEDWELIIADDGSDDPTRAFLRQLSDARIRVLLLAHSGNPSAVRNAAIGAACGRFLAFLDSDDLWAPEKLERQLALMSATPGRRWSYSAVRRIDADGREVGSAGIRPWFAFEGDIVEPLLKLDALLATPAVIAERELVISVGAFDELQRFCEDYDLWLRLALRSEVSAFDEPLASVRVHEHNYSQDRMGAYEGWIQLYGRYACTLADEHQRRICRRRRAECALSLAAMYWRSNRRRRALRTFADSARDGWPQWRWWPTATRTLLGLLTAGARARNALRI
jgi:glycosyltransferase involved in cell wall biosynthesis